MTFRIIVCGGRDYGERVRGKELWVAHEERRHVYDVLTAIAEEAGGLLTVVEGGGSGAASCARAWCFDSGYQDTNETFASERPGPGLPEWAALKKRSREMIDAGGDLVVVFPGGMGTLHEVELARAAGIKIRDERAKGPGRGGE